MFLNLPQSYASLAATRLQKGKAVQPAFPSSPVSGFRQSKNRPCPVACPLQKQAQPSSERAVSGAKKTTWYGLSEKTIIRYWCQPHLFGSNHTVFIFSSSLNVPLSVQVSILSDDLFVK